MRQFSKFITGAALAAASFASAATPHSIFSFTEHFAGGPLSDVTTPWVTASFADIATDTVRMTISGSGLEPGQRVNSLYFNVTTPMPLSFSWVSGPAAATTAAAGNSFRAGGSGFYDLQITFDPRPTVGGTPNPDVFGSGQSSTYVITGPGLSSASFIALSSTVNANGGGGTGHGPFYAAGKLVHSASGGSSWVHSGAPVTAAPEPQTYAMMLLGLALVAGAVRRRRRAAHFSG